MKLGDVLAKERKRKEFSPDEVASSLGISLHDYQEMENGKSGAEIWGPILANLAINLETPLARLLAETGRSVDVRQDGAARLIALHCARRGLSLDKLAECSGCSTQQLNDIEAGGSPLVETGRRLLRFAELIEQPVFNLLYPCGLPLEKIEDYP